MPSQTLARSFSVDKAIPLLEVRRKKPPPSTSKPPSTAVFIEPEPHVPATRKERNYWEDDEEEEEKQAREESPHHLETPTSHTDSATEEGLDERDEAEDTPAEQVVLTSFFTTIVTQEHSSFSAVSLHLTAFYSSMPFPGESSQLDVPSASEGTCPSNQLIWLLRKRCPSPGLRNFRQLPSQKEPQQEEYSVGALWLQREALDILGLSFYDKNTLAVLYTTTTTTTTQADSSTVDGVEQPYESNITSFLSVLNGS